MLNAKNTKIRAIAAILSLAMVSESTLALAHSGVVIGRPITNLVSNVAAQNALENLAKEYNSAQDAKDFNSAIEAEKFVNGLTENDIQLQDVKDYAKARMTKKEYLDFSKNISGLIEQAKTQELLPEDMKPIFEQAFKTGSQKQTFTGCAGTVIGAVLIAGAVTVGVIALFKARGENGIRRTFNRRRQKSTNTYNAEINRIDMEPTRLQSQISNLNEENKQISYDIAFKTGQALGTNDINEKNRLLAEIQNLGERINSNNSEITRLGNELHHYTNPSYVAELKNVAYVTFTNDTARFNQREQELIIAIPENKRLAKTLGIGAGVGALVGTLLLIDGIHDGGCR